MPLSVVILAAGQGKRMNSDLPKVLQPLAGRPLLAHVLDTARQLEARATYVVYGHGGERVREAFADRGVHWALQAEQQGTGHAVAQAMPQIDDNDDVLVLYGDVPLVTAQTLRPLIESCTERSIGILSVMFDDPTGYGRIIRDGARNVVRIVEQKDANAKERAVREGNTGLMCVPARHLRGWLAALRNDNAQQEYYLTDIVVMAVKAGIKVQAVVASDAAELVGVNDRVQLSEVEAIYRRRRAREIMRAGATLVDPLRFDARGPVHVGRDVVIDVNVVLEGEVTLGDGVQIGPNVCIRNSRLGARTVVFASSVIESAEVGRDCRIGPFARLRPEAHLHEEVHIGNFVEVKKSELKRGAKANHLTYLGDATIGEQANVGAGTVTCHYDGVIKSRTQIGARAFIGSGTMLVAPVRIGDGATIGAGSTITHDAPPDKLTLERSKQVTVEAWKRPQKK
jgi:bifunctional UDP-N-acetylglucosamine pyrophosphorylase/glucosamine-1-phosphate N-acetyltransferase